MSEVSIEDLKEQYSRELLQFDLIVPPSQLFTVQNKYLVKDLSMLLDGRTQSSIFIINKTASNGC